LLFELNFPFLVHECSWNIRSSKIDELEQIAEAHAEVALIESGVNPLEKDREGFLKRTLRRIEKERTFVVFDHGKSSSKPILLLNRRRDLSRRIYVASEYRRKGIASGCLSKLSRQLLGRVQNICLLAM